jgi:selenocysteine-specific elongation factor
VVALPGDRFILRGFQKQENHGTTIGGGRVLRVLCRRTRPRDASAVALLGRIAGADPLARVGLELEAAGPAGLTRAALQERLPFVPAEVDRHLGRLRELRQVIGFDKESGATVHALHFQALRERTIELCDRYHAEHPLEAGMGREELRTRLGGPTLDPRLYFAVLQALERGGELVVERELCRRPAHRIESTRQPLQEIAERARARYRSAALAPPREPELAAELSVDPGTLSSALKMLCESGELVRVGGGLLFDREALAGLREKLRAFLEREGQITPPQWKEIVGQSRKFTIPLAEYFDAQKLTLRIGDLRKLRR